LHDLFGMVLTRVSYMVVNWVWSSFFLFWWLPWYQHSWFWIVLITVRSLSIPMFPMKQWHMSCFHGQCWVFCGWFTVLF